MSGNDDEGVTRQTMLPQSSSPDDQPTGHVADVGIVAELRAVLTNGEKKTLPLYRLADQLVVGRGTACEWQLDDQSLSRKHAQLRWSGRELTVEDMGSANGTRVNGKPARTPTPAHPGEVIQLGTVMITLELREGARANPDDQSTNMTQLPSTAPPQQKFPNLPGLATTVRPPKIAHAPGPVPSGQQVYRPSKDAARPDEPTRPFDPRAALYHPPEKAFDGELMERIKEQWRTNRRPFVLGGAALWVGLLLGFWYLHDSMAPVEDVAIPRVQAPKVTSLNPPSVPQVVVEPSPAPLADAEKDEQIAQAVAAYEQGRLAEALGLFQRLPSDETARFMVELIQQRLAQGVTAP